MVLPSQARTHHSRRLRLCVVVLRCAVSRILVLREDNLADEAAASTASTCNFAASEVMACIALSITSRDLKVLLLKEESRGS